MIYLQTLVRKLNSYPNFTYVVAYSRKNYVDYRIEPFKDLGLKKSGYNRMRHYWFKKQLPLNILIIDDKILYLGMYSVNAGLRTYTGTRITGQTEAGKVMINNFITWYDDNVLIDKCLQNNNELFNLKD